MSSINTYEKQNRNILRLNFERKKIDLSPDYQRNGEIWNLEKRQLLIDSILNDYDIPKIYFHFLNPTGSTKDKIYDYAVIDGRQRLETIWMFIDEKFKLADDFKYFKDDKVDARGLSYSELAKEYPDLKGLFDSFNLPIICIETDDLDLIDDMFLRLNEAVPLNAAEKRNAIRGPMVQAINNVCKHSFFTQNIRFSNKRFQHKEVACRLLFLTWTIKTENKILDTKKPLLDDFVRQFKISKHLKAKPIENDVLTVLDEMSKTFLTNDILLRSQSYIPIYYLLFGEFLKANHKVNRQKLIAFRDDIQKNKTLAETDISKVNYELIEFDRLSIQGTNDASSIKERLRIILNYFDSKKNNLSNNSIYSLLNN